MNFIALNREPLLLDYFTIYCKFSIFKTITAIENQTPLLFVQFLELKE